MSARRGLIRIRLTGGEPLLGRDVTRLNVSLYSLDPTTIARYNGHPVLPEELAGLAAAGLASIELSFTEWTP